MIAASFIAMEGNIVSEVKMKKNREQESILYPKMAEIRGLSKGEVSHGVSYCGAQGTPKECLWN